MFYLSKHTNCFLSYKKMNMVHAGCLVSCSNSLSNRLLWPAGSLKSKISDTRYKCSGNIKVKVEGQWLPVCKDAINDIETQNTICSQMKCGHAIGLLDHFGPPPVRGLVISNLQWQSSCNETSKACSVAKKLGRCALADIRCSGKTSFQNCHCECFKLPTSDFNLFDRMEENGGKI